MWNRLANLLSARADETSLEDEDERLRASAAVLMIQAALADGDFSTDERRRIHDALADLFNLGARDVESLLNQAEARAAEAVDLFAQTRLLTRGLEESERLKIVEALWKVVDADNLTHDYEAALMRKVAGLLGLDDRDVAMARKRARGQ